MCGYSFNSGFMGGFGLIMPLMIIAMLIFTIAIGYFLFNIIREFSNPNKEALKELSKRFANGEISKSEYDEIRKSL